MNSPNYQENKSIRGENDPKLTSCGLHTKSTYPFTSGALLHISILGANHTAITKIATRKKVKRQNKSVQFNKMKPFISTPKIYDKWNGDLNRAKQMKRFQVKLLRYTWMRIPRRDYGLLTDFQNCNRHWKSFEIVSSKISAKDSLKRNYLNNAWCLTYLLNFHITRKSTMYLQDWISIAWRHLIGMASHSIQNCIAVIVLS